MDTEKYAFVTDEIEHDINNLSENEMKLYKKLKEELNKSRGYLKTNPEEK